MSSNFTPILLSGGSGTRLWPLSRADVPKQFCHIFDETLFESSLRRVGKHGKALVISSLKLKALTDKKIKDLDLGASSLYEPESKNTCAAIGLACRYFELKDSTETVVGVFPADHIVGNQKEFHKVVEEAIDVCRSTKGIVVLGIDPNYPSSEYGYIEFDTSIKQKYMSVLSFHEKPDRETAEKYLRGGNFLWNAGIFFFRIKDMIQYLKELAPRSWAAWESLTEISHEELVRVYKDLTNESIDTAIIEKLPERSIKCLKLTADWNDVGTWDALSNFPEAGVPSSQLILEQSKNVFVHGPKDKVYSAIDIDNVIVVDTPDALVVMNKGSSAKMKSVLNRIAKNHPNVVNLQKFEERPWGSFEVLKETKEFKSKLLRVRPLSQISYQSHNNREEHWIVVSGNGVVIIDSENTSIKHGEYIHIPKGSKHRIRNTSLTHELLIVEVQLGTYFGEDDIVRYEDDYNR